MPAARRLLGRSPTRRPAPPTEPAVRPGLSLVMLVHEPATQVAAIVRLFEGIADEVVVAVDSRVDPATLGALEPVTDTLVRVEHEPPFARSAPWLHRLATRSWVFVLDGDEVPGTALLERLRSVRRLEPYATHAYVGRRWLWPDPESYLVAEPWRENPALRITPRDDRALGWHRRLHEQVRVAGPGVYLPEDLYHLDTALTTEAERRAKIERYDRLNPDPLPGSGGTANAAWYLPEDLPERPETAPVPPEDLALVRRVVQARTAPVVRATRQLPLYTREQVRAVVTGRPEGLEHRGTVTARDARLSLAPGAGTAAYVAVRNDGDWTWRAQGDGLGVRVGWHWDAPDGTVLHEDAGRADLTSDLPPGESVLVPVPVVAPAEPGSYVLRVGLVDELVAWFDGPARVDVEVAEPAVVLTFPPHEAEAVRQALATCRTYLEFGAGGSTVLAAQTGVPRVVSVETDPDYLARVSELVAEQGGDVAYEPLLVDIGPTGGWGFPVDDSGVKRWAQYTTTPWRHLGQLGWEPDLVLVDGRFRAACLLQALAHLRPGATVLFDDYGHRPHYWLVEQVLHPVRRHGRLAVFEVPDLSADQLRALADLLPQVLLDPR